MARDRIIKPVCSKPHYVLFAGVNGVGKSTLFRSGLWQNGVDANSLARVNSDEILASHGWDWANPTDQLRAGREVVRQIKRYFEALESFNQETTLSGHSIMRNVAHAKELGYVISLYYVGIQEPEIANERIAHRTAVGGHGIDGATVTRRWQASLGNLVAAAPFCDKVLLYDNTVVMRLVARIDAGDLSFYELNALGITWQNDIIERLMATFSVHA